MTTFKWSKKWLCTFSWIYRWSSAKHEKQTMYIFVAQDGKNGQTDRKVKKSQGWTMFVNILVFSKKGRRKGNAWWSLFGKIELLRNEKSQLFVNTNKKWRNKRLDIKNVHTCLCLKSYSLHKALSKFGSFWPFCFCVGRVIVQKWQIVPLLTDVAQLIVACFACYWTKYLYLFLKSKKLQE